MPQYHAPKADFEFVLKEYLALEPHAALPGFEGAGELVTPLLDEGARLCEEVLFPLNQPGDAIGLTYDKGTVTTPPGFKEAYKQYCDGGWPSFTCNPEYGGQGLPEVLNMPFMEMACSSNLAFGMTPGLSHGAINAIEMHGSAELKAKYLPNMVSGQWTGVMCLTEPQCGTDLGLIRSVAEPEGDGYHISGGKIFISSGEHDKAENIIHLVLARLPDAPKGTRGISLFLVPKIMVGADGSLGERNGVWCSGLEEKMGIHASPTCAMQYDKAKGWLVGKPHEGLKAMFTMMNEARLYVGLQGLGLAEVAFQNALAYAKDRVQGRMLPARNARLDLATPDKAADPILVHADVRRMLYEMKAFCEGMRALILETALQNDLRRKSPDAATREAAESWMQIMTPIIKAYGTDMGFAVASNAMQVLGGYGYIREYGVEQYARDARIAMIYEGTNGIQALDLVGRKLPQRFGANLRVFFYPASEFVEKHRETPGMAEFTKPLHGALNQLRQATLWMASQGLSNPNDTAAGATDYLRMFALTVMAFVWAKQAEIALRGGGGSSAEFYTGKLDTARFFMQRVLPEATGCLIKLTGGSAAVMAGTI